MTSWKRWKASEAQVEPARRPRRCITWSSRRGRAAALPAAGPALSIFSDRDEAELARLDAQAAEVLRLDGLLKERDTALRPADTAHIRHLEELVAVTRPPGRRTRRQLATLQRPQRDASHDRQA